MLRWKTFRYDPLAEQYDVGICVGGEGCTYSKVKHHWGYADPYGTIHWKRWYASPTRRKGLYRLLTLIAVVKMKQHRRPGLPKWMALYEQSRWAHREGLNTWHIRFPIAYSSKERRKARELVKRQGVPTAVIGGSIYHWMHAEHYKSRNKE